MIPHLSELVAQVRCAYPAPHGLFLHLGDCVVEVRTNSPDLLRELSGYFGSFARPEGAADIRVTAHEAPVPNLPFSFRAKSPDPGKARIKEEWADIPGGRVVRKRLTGLALFFGGTDHLAVGPCLDNPNQIVNFINNRYIERKLDRGAILGHAAAVCLGDQGLALAGFSGMGKSTLALHAMDLGADFVSNDRVLVGRDPVSRRVMIHGVAKHPRINPGTALNNPRLARVVAPEDRERFLALPPDQLWGLEHKYDAIIEDCFGPGRFRLAAPFSGLVLLNWRRGEGPARIARVDPARRRDLLPAVMKSPGLFYPGAEEREVQDLPVGAWLDLLHDRVVLEISGGVDFDLAARACMDFLGTGKIPGTAGA